jgi:hypothetical protein
MLIFFDESGDFAYSNKRSISLVASFICPNSEYNRLIKFYKKYIANISTEVKGKNISYSNRIKLLEFLNKYNKYYKFTIHFIDTSVTPNEDLQQFRKNSSELILSMHKKYLDDNFENVEDEVNQKYIQLKKHYQLSSRFSDPLFLQWILSVSNVPATIQHMIACYFLYDLPLKDFVNNKFIFDQKGKNLTILEKYIRDNLSTLLWYQSQTENVEPLILPTTWQDSHPFVKKYQTSNGIDLELLMKNLSFEPSEDHVGLQVVDIIANTIYQFLLNQKNDDYYRCYRLLMPNLCGKKEVLLHGITFKQSNGL